jgi:hypothetical protein
MILPYLIKTKDKRKKIKEKRQSRHLLLHPAKAYGMKSSMISKKKDKRKKIKEKDKIYL